MKLPQNKILIAVAGIIILILVLAAGWFFFLRDSSPTDTKKPELHLTNLAADEWLSTNEDKVTLNGLAVDESGIESIKWETQNGISGIAVISGGEWTIENIPLQQGDNQITITGVTDSSGVALFNFTVGPTMFVNQNVDIASFVTETSYNQLGLITATGAGFFEVSSIAFTADDATGDFSSG